VTPKNKVAIVGCGHWGKNLLRNFYNLEALVMACDTNRDQLLKLKKQYPGLHITTQFEDLLAHPEVSGVVISTPSHTHFALAKAALLAGKHVYVEKPMATTTQDAQELCDLAKQLGKILMVGHLLMYHPVVNRLKQLIEEGFLGEIRYIESDRLNHNPNRADRSVFWDLAPHDLSMMMYLTGKTPTRVLSVQGSQTSADGLVDIAHIEVGFEGCDTVGHVHNSWVHPVKQVKLVVKGALRTAVIDDTLSGKDKIRIFSNTSPPQEIVPEYLLLEPLKLECQHFLNCMQTGRTPKSDGQNGFNVVKILEEAEIKLQESGIQAQTV